VISVRHNAPRGGDEGARFREGQIVRHRRYGYRGVVVAFDLECRADDAWYRKNQTRPAREQPWYHLLVDGSEHLTYAAEENLMPDPDLTPVAHPLIAVFFAGLGKGGYVRNERPFEGWP
jgi:heat shock protein HspQ